MPLRSPLIGIVADYDIAGIRVAGQKVLQARKAGKAFAGSPVEESSNFTKTCSTPNLKEWLPLQVGDFVDEIQLVLPSRIPFFPQSPSHSCCSWEKSGDMFIAH